MTSNGPSRNRLGSATSPYLLLHRHNPVHWHPWDREALQRSRDEDKPIFLSVGYSTCYWCHVMERESFSDPQIAELMNRHFVSIKLDREERPDLDELYMTATHILTRHGGWPNSVFLTPDLKPFFAGTYFPPEDRPGHAGFRTVLSSLAEAWSERRDEVSQQADEVAAAMRRYLEESHRPADQPPAAELMDRCQEDLRRRFDSTWGGFGSAPKFPSPSNLLLLLESHDGESATMLSHTLDAMARGGIYDQLAGGFHRYATDRAWRVPHFEKMLYDNGLLLEVYARYWQRSGDPEAARIVGETADFVADEMTGPEGELWSAIDAETDGHEGAYYIWRREELTQVLGDEDFGFLAPILGFAGPPVFEGRFHVLHLPEPLLDQAERRRWQLAELLAELTPLRHRLLAARRRRPRPATDDKVLADWNGIAIKGLVEAGRLLARQQWVRQGEAAARFVLSHLRTEGGLAHSWRRGRCGPAAFLSDYAYLVRGLLALHRATGERRWLEEAAALAAEQRQRLGDPRGGYHVAAPSEDVLFRSKEVMDGAIPGANAVAILNLVELAEQSGDSEWLAEAEKGLSAFAELADRHPAAVKTLAVANHRLRRALSYGEQAPSNAAEADGASRPSRGTAIARAVATELELGRADGEGWRAFRLQLAIAEGWHLSAPSPAYDASGALHLRGDGARLRAVRYPPGVPADGDVPEGPRVYRGRIEIRGELQLAGSGPARLRVLLQACDSSRCLPPSCLEVPIES